MVDLLVGLMVGLDNGRRSMLLLDEEKIEKIQNDSIRNPVKNIAEFLQNHLGQKMTAYLCGLNDSKNVGQWISGRVSPKDLSTMKLRCAYYAVRMIIDAFDDETAKAWLFGTNTRLNDEAPAYILRYSKTVEDLRNIVPIARTFATARE